MSTWVLIFYMSVGFGNGVHGGPATIEGFTSQQTCNAEIVKMNSRKHVDFAYCIEVIK